MPSNRIGILFQGKPLQDKDRLNQCGITEGELLYMTMLPPPVQNHQGQGGLNIADMIKNFDRNRKNSNSLPGFVEPGIEQFMKSA